nr:MAG TPA: hypothetical protein [Caudoviricetes sp.]
MYGILLYLLNGSLDNHLIKLSKGENPLLFFIDISHINRYNNVSIGICYTSIF